MVDVANCFVVYYILCKLFSQQMSIFLYSPLPTYGVTKNNPSGNFVTIYWIQTQYILLLGEQVLKIFLCIKRVSLNCNFIVNDVQRATYSSHGDPCPARDLFPWINTRVKIHISLWTIREYPKRHFRYLWDSGDTFLPLILVKQQSDTTIHDKQFATCTFTPWYNSI